MELRDILGMLDRVSGPNASGEYLARCPAHDDQTASLTVREKASEKDGKRRIYLCCHAGCTGEAVMRALGLKPRDLIVDPDPDWQGGRQRQNRQRPAPSPPDPPQDGAELGLPGTEIRQAKPREAAKPRAPIDIHRPDRVYSYTDAEGQELFQVCRYQYTENGKREKTFRQRRHAPGDPKADREGWVYSVPPELRDNTIYRMPKVAQAIQDGRTVYVVEGEKDVETLERLGHVATCNPGGAGKWRPGYTRQLRGADVIILPDNDTAGNDYTGQNHAYQVALSLLGTAKRVRLVNIAECCVQLPDKGDVSDLVQLLGDTEGMDALARQVAATRDFDPNDVPFWLTPMEQAQRLYSQVQGYGVTDDGCIAVKNNDGVKPLTDFVVIPRMELTRDDGVTQSLWFVLDGWGSGCRRLGRVTISAKEMDSMSWVTGKWGFAASMAPGTATKDKVAWAIKKVGQMTAKRVTEYNHSGWRRIDGKWCYLYHGGAVGADGVSVDLGDALKAYRLDGGGAAGFDSISLKEAALQSYVLQGLFSEVIGVALLGTVYLAPLREFMQQTDVVPAFALYLYGESGTHKTTAAALALSHFGNFHAKNPPASFSDTGNQIRKKAFYLKDMPLLVDDYHPTSSVQEKRQMAAVAQSLSRAFGDGVDRGRLNADTSLKANTPPRSVAIITGEDLPAIGASGLARFFVLDIDKGDIPVTADLTEAQEKARQGYLQKAMRGYIEYLQGITEELPAQLHELFLHYREQIRRGGEGQHDRAPESTACILIGYHMMLEYFKSLGVFDAEVCAGLLAHARQLLGAASAKQTRDMESEKPTRIFIDGLTELLSAHRICMKDLSLPLDQQKDPPANEDMVGYLDKDYFYLLPSVAFAAVQRLCREQGVEFPVSLKALYKHLRTDGILEGLGTRENPTRNKWVDGRTVRLLWIPRGIMQGPMPSEQQLELREVVDPDLPKNW